MRLEVTVNQNFANNRMESFQEVKENANGYLKILKRIYDQMAKVRIPIKTYKEQVNEKIHLLKKKLKRDT